MSLEMAELYQHTTPKARKLHACCECRGRIQPGEVYHIHAGVWEGEWSNYKICGDCEAMHEEAAKGIKDPEERAGFTGLGEWVMEGNAELIGRFLEIKKRRGAEVPPWMEHRLAKAKEGK